MARGNLPAQTPQVPVESFVAFDMLYRYAQNLGLDLKKLEVGADATIVSATFVAVAGTNVTDTSTFDGYTIGQIVTALKQAGILT